MKIQDVGLSGVEFWPGAKNGAPGFLGLPEGSKKDAFLIEAKALPTE